MGSTRAGLGWAAGLAVLALAGCRDGSPPNEPPARRTAEDAPRERVFTPSPGLVRSVGPYPITGAGVGLYTLGAEMPKVLEILPTKAPVDTLDIEGVVKHKVVPPDGERILVGFDSRGMASFVAVVAPDIALVDGRFGVGSPVDELLAGLGPEVKRAAVRDPHILELEKLANARFVVDGGRVIAIVVAEEPRAARAEQAEADAPCARAAEILAGSVPGIQGPDGAARAAWGCFTGGQPEVAVPEGDELVVYGGEPGRLRRITSVAAPGLQFAGALDVDRDGRHEVVSVAERRGDDALAARIVVWRGEGGRLSAAADKEVYRMTSGAAGWVGHKLKDVSFLVQAAAASTSSIEVRGLYLQRGEDGGARTVAPLVAETVAVRPRRAPAGPGAGGGGEPAKGQEGDKRPGGERPADEKKPEGTRKSTRGGGGPPGRETGRDASDM